MLALHYVPFKRLNEWKNVNRLPKHRLNKEEKEAVKEKIQQSINTVYVEGTQNYFLYNLHKFHILVI